MSLLKRKPTSVCMCVLEGCCQRHMHLTISPVSSTTHRGIFISRRGAIPQHLETQWSVRGCDWMQKIKTDWERFRRTQWKKGSGTLKSIPEHSVSKRQSGTNRIGNQFRQGARTLSRLEILQREGQIMAEIKFSSLEKIQR